MKAVTDMFKLTRSTQTVGPRRVCVLGVGGGVCRALNCVVGGAGGPSVAAINTDSQSLSESKAMTKIQIGIEDADGFGAGGDPDLGRLAAEHDVEMMRGLFTDADVAIVVTCLGGGTGTGATPVVLDTARAAGVFTIVLATLPFAFESQKRTISHQAPHLLDDLRDRPSPLGAPRVRHDAETTAHVAPLHD